MRKAILVMALLFGPQVAQAQDLSTISAGNPQGLVTVLEMAGYSPSLDADAQGDPKITLELAGYNTTIFFYGCDEETKKGCNSLSLSAGFDRKNPMTSEEAIEISKNYRFAAVRLDEEGDPYIMWDIYTGDGIPAKVFLQSLHAFTGSIEDVSDVVFAAERRVN